MSLKPKRTTLKKRKPTYEETIADLQKHRTHRQVTIKSPADTITREEYSDAILNANKGAKSFQAFQLDSKNFSILEYDREPDSLILRAKVTKCWEAGHWTGQRMTSIVTPIKDISIQHMEREQMGYYSDLLKDSGVRAENHRAFRTSDGNVFVEYIITGFEEKSWVKI